MFTIIIAVAIYFKAIEDENILLGGMFFDVILFLMAGGLAYEVIKILTPIMECQ